MNYNKINISRKGSSILEVSSQQTGDSAIPTLHLGEC